MDPGLIESQAHAAPSGVPPSHRPPPLNDLPPDVAVPAKGEGAGGRLKLFIVAAIIIGYASLSYFGDSEPEASGLAAGLSFGPVVLIGLVLVWRWTPPLVAILILALVCAVLYEYWSFFRSNYQWSNLVQQVGAYGLVALSFTRSLSAGRVPLCTQLTHRLHGPLVPAEVAYTRRATVAWAVFYLLLTSTIALLFFAAPQRVWSLFVNVMTFGLIGLMFIIEHTVRLKLLPRLRRGGILAALRQFLVG